MGMWEHIKFMGKIFSRIARLQEHVANLLNFL